jgi:hypothetical protein
VMTMLKKKVNVKINGIPNVCLDSRYLASTKRTVTIAEVGNVLVNVFVREDDEGLVDFYAILHIEADVVDKARSDLLVAYGWAVGMMAEMAVEGTCSAPDRRSRR